MQLQIKLLSMLLLAAVAQPAIGIGFAQFAAWVDRVFGAGAGNGGPELHAAAFGLEVFAIETTEQFGGVDGGWRGANRDAQVPGGQINH